MRFILAALIGLSLSSTALAGPHHVRPEQVVVVHAAPPPVMVVAPPMIRPEFVWVNGYWVGRAWYPGHWERVGPAFAINAAFGPVQVTYVR